MITGFALSFARALGEYGSVVCIAGNMPMKTEITPLLIMTKLEQFDYPGATSIAVVMLVTSFALLGRRIASRPGAGSGAPHDARTRLDPQRGAPRRAAASSSITRVILIAVSLIFLTLFLFLPVLTVFVEALRDGLGAYVAAVTDESTLAAVRLTMLTTAIAVPLNVVFGLAAAWAITRFEFPGKSLLITLIDLPFAVSPVISGMLYVLRRAGAARAHAAGARHPHHLRGARDRAGDDLRHLSLRGAGADPLHAEPGDRGGSQAALVLGASGFRPSRASRCPT